MSFHLDGIEKMILKKLQNCDYQQVYKSDYSLSEMLES